MCDKKSLTLSFFYIHSYKRRLTVTILLGQNNFISTNDSKQKELTISYFASICLKKNDLQTGNKISFTIKKKLRLKTGHIMVSIYPHK